MSYNALKTINPKGGRPKIANKKFKMGFAVSTELRDKVISLARKSRVSNSAIISEAIRLLPDDFFIKLEIKEKRRVGRPSKIVK